MLNCEGTRAMDGRNFIRLTTADTFAAVAAGASGCSQQLPADDVAAWKDPGFEPDGCCHVSSAPGIERSTPSGPGRCAHGVAYCGIARRNTGLERELNMSFCAERPRRVYPIMFANPDADAEAMCTIPHSNGRAAGICCFSCGAAVTLKTTFGRQA